MEQIKVVLDIFRTHNIILYILFISSGLITFDFLSLRERLGLDGLDKLYFAIIGMIFLISVSCLAFLLINTLFGGLKESIERKIHNKNVLKKADETLCNLTNSEIVVLSLYLFDEADTVWLPMQGTEVTSLVSKKIIYLSSKVGRGISNGMTIFHYSLNPIVKEKVIDYLNNFFENFSKDDTANFFRSYSPNYLEELDKAKRLWNL